MRSVAADALGAAASAVAGVVLTRVAEGLGAGSKKIEATTPGVQRAADRAVKRGVAPQKRAKRGAATKKRAAKRGAATKKRAAKRGAATKKRTVKRGAASKMGSRRRKSRAAKKAKPIRRKKR